MQAEAEEDVKGEGDGKMPQHTCSRSSLTNHANGATR